MERRLSHVALSRGYSLCGEISSVIIILFDLGLERKVQEIMSPNREKHNAMEKRRRRIIRDHFDGLKDSIRNQKDVNGFHPKLSRSQTLQKAKLRIQELKLSITKTKDSLGKIRAQNRALEDALQFYKTNRQLAEYMSESLELHSTRNEAERYPTSVDIDDESECVVVIEVSSDSPSSVEIQN